jgi:hypothetical protein
MVMYSGMEVYFHASNQELDGVEWSASHPQKETLIPTGQEAGWIPEPVLPLLGIKFQLLDHPPHDQSLYGMY